MLIRQLLRNLLIAADVVTKEIRHWRSNESFQRENLFLSVKISNKPWGSRMSKRVSGHRNVKRQKEGIKNVFKVIASSLQYIHIKKIHNKYNINYKRMQLQLTCMKGAF